MPFLIHLFQSKWKTHLLLFLLSFVIYFTYFQTAFLNLNTILTSIVDDSLKNYYTYVYHIKNDSNLLHFSGFNYPFGEHVVYTDCQPLLTFILHYLPFTHNYLIGIMHFLIFFSFLITPSILLMIFERLQFPRFPGFFISLAVTLLSPQFFRIFCGHYALAYTCIIPLSILLLLRYLQSPKRSLLIGLFLFNTLLFLIHPYYGLGLSLFSFFSIFLFEILQKRYRLKPLLISLFLGVLPILIFKGFMALTDDHPDRPLEPIGNTDFISSRSSFLIPLFGPFKAFLEKVVQSGPSHFEGYAYLGLASIVITAIFILTFPFLVRKSNVKKEFLALFFSAMVLLLFSFGIQFKVQEMLGVKISALNQFRAMGRFSWFLYFTLPFLIFPFLYDNFQRYISTKKLNQIFGILSLVFLSFNLLEAHYYFHMYQDVMWKDRNLFLEKCLNKNEKNVIQQVNTTKPQAILPLPIYFVGSEVYDRSEFTTPLIHSTIYSYHCSLPIVSLCASRSSISETEEGMEILNAYKKNKLSESLFTEQDFFVIKTNKALMEDEQRILKRSKLFASYDTTQYGFITKTQLLKPWLDPSIFEISKQNIFLPDSNHIVYLAHENRKPFLESNYLNYEMVYILDSNLIPSGTYNASIHFHAKNKTFKEMSGAFIVTRANASEYVWQDVIPLKVFSGFYDGFAVSERLIQLERNNKYEFMIHGNYDLNYKVSHFLLRPASTTVRVITEANDTIYNNYPK